MDSQIKFKSLLITVLAGCFLISTLLKAQEENTITEIEINQEALSGQEFAVAKTRLVGPGVDADVDYTIHQEYGVIEGDIYIPLAEPQQRSSDSSGGVIIDGYRWPNKTLYYRFDNSVVQNTKNVIRLAASYIQSRTSVRFVELSSPNRYHVLITDNVSSDGTGRSGCYSFVGYRADRFGATGFQRLNLQRKVGNSGHCHTRGIAIHELMHALGVWHEQSREDRNSFVTIHYQNIASNKTHNFNQQITDGTDVGAYDYSSIMHYGAYAFSKNGSRTIVPRQSGVNIGQREFMSNGDITSLNRLYPPSTTPPPANAAYKVLPPIIMLLLDEDE